MTVLLSSIYTSGSFLFPDCLQSLALFPVFWSHTVSLQQQNSLQAILFGGSDEVSLYITRQWWCHLWRTIKFHLYRYSTEKLISAVFLSLNVKESVDSVSLITSENLKVFFIQYLEKEKGKSSLLRYSHLFTCILMSGKWTIWWTAFKTVHQLLEDKCLRTSLSIVNNFMNQLFTCEELVFWSLI